MKRSLRTKHSECDISVLQNVTVSITLCQASVLGQTHCPRRAKYSKKLPCPVIMLVEKNCLSSRFSSHAGSENIAKDRIPSRSSLVGTDVRRPRALLSLSAALPHWRR